MCLVRADAGPRIGSGHVSRTAALAAELTARHWQVRYVMAQGVEAATPFLTGKGIDVISLASPEAHSASALKAALPGGVDLMLLDHYGFDVEFECALGGWARRIAALDDVAGSRRHDVDLLIDFTPGIGADNWREHVSVRTNVLAGVDYALIRPEIVAQRGSSLAARQKTRPVQRIAISLGASDSRNAAELALHAARQALPTATIDVLISETSVHAARVAEATKSLDAQLHIDAPDYPAILAAADLAIGGGGVSALERACLGLPSILIALAPNQKPLVTSLSEARVAHFIGSIDAVTPTTLVAAIGALANDASKRVQMSAQGAALVDGKGCHRVADAIEEMFRPPVTRQRAP